jgi:hypothetical protein
MRRYARLDPPPAGVLPGVVPPVADMPQPSLPGGGG